MNSIICFFINNIINIFRYPSNKSEIRSDTEKISRHRLNRRTLLKSQPASARARASLVQLPPALAVLVLYIHTNTHTKPALAPPQSLKSVAAHYTHTRIHRSQPAASELHLCNSHDQAEVLQEALQEELLVQASAAGGRLWRRQWGRWWCWGD